jgi:translation initiation factor IF-2
VLKVGDNFVVNSCSVGKVKALFDSAGKHLKKLLPYQVAKVVGLSSVAKTGAMLEFVPITLLGKVRDECLAPSVNLPKETDLSSSSESAITIILKADGYGTADGLIKGILLMTKKNPKFKSMVNIIATSIGNIFEKDIIIAEENNAIILGMNVVLEKNAAELVRSNKVVVKIESIIYRLVDTVEQLVIDKLRSMKELKQIGKGYVKKVFVFKGRGIIAGCQITDGVFADKTVVHIFRGGIKIGEGRVLSLHQEKKTMKEVPEGQDCGILCTGFTDWNEADRVVCFAEVSLY